MTRIIEVDDSNYAVMQNLRIPVIRVWRADELRLHSGPQRLQPRQLTGVVFRQPILAILRLGELRGLDDCDERHRRHVVVVKAEVLRIFEFADHHWEATSARVPFWLHQMHCQRSRMISDGLLAAASPRGWWGLSAAGKRDADRFLATPEGQRIALLLS